MPTVKKWFRQLILNAFFLAFVPISNAQGTSIPDTSASSSNYLLILLGLVAVILAFVIYGMGQVLLSMGKHFIDKSKQKNKILSAIIIGGGCLLTHPANAQETLAAETGGFTINYGGLDSTGFWVLVVVLATEIIVIACMMLFIQRLQAELLPQKKKQWFTFKKTWADLDKKLFTKAVAVEEESNVTLEHEYDGIRELDNSLPPWWKYGFLATIVIAFIYMMNFHVFGYGKNPTEEYQAELLKAKEQKEEYEAKNKDKVDESNLTMPSVDGINAGKEIFTGVCAACHGKQGEGGAGPNLADNYWLHKGSLSDIYQSIKHGYPEKGMQGWEKNYSPKEINNLAGFIKTLRGTNPPNAKAPQGDLFTEEPGPDSTAVPAPPIRKDSITVKKNAAEN